MPRATREVVRGHEGDAVVTWLTAGGLHAGTDRDVSIRGIGV